jgi:hypothetical protein
MTTDFRAELQRLVEAIKNWDFDTGSLEQDWSALDRAEAALAQPAPKDLFARIDTLLDGIDRDECHPDGGWWQTSDGSKFGCVKLRELKELIVSSLSPSRPAIHPEPVAPTDEEVRKILMSHGILYQYQGNLLTAGNPGIPRSAKVSDIALVFRALLARWGTPANALPTPEATNV